MTIVSRRIIIDTETERVLEHDTPTDQILAEGQLFARLDGVPVGRKNVINNVRVPMGTDPVDAFARWKELIAIGLQSAVEAEIARQERLMQAQADAAAALKASNPN